MKKIVLLFALLLCSLSLTVKADIYTDGLRKMVTEGMATYNPEEMMSALQNAGIKKEYLSYDDVIDIMVDVLAMYYREGFTEEQFEQYMTFYSQPKMAAVLKKNIQFSKSLKQELESFMQTTALLIKCGMEPSDLKATHCSKGYQAAFKKYWEFNKYDYVLSSTVDALEQAVAEGDAQTKATMQAIIAYLKKNMSVVVRNTLLETMNEEDLKLFLTVTEQPFAESVTKVGEIFTKRSGEVASVLEEKIKAKMYANMFGPMDDAPKQPEIREMEE